MTKSPLLELPSVGPNLAADLEAIGIAEVEDLKGKKPEELFSELQKSKGIACEKTTLYVFRCAVYYAETQDPEPEKLKWWNWRS